MALALRVARHNLGQTWPNPAVGAVVVSGAGEAARVVAMGATGPGGRPHGEYVALQDAGASARDATCYVTLEPCAHHGRTPPCTDALVAAGVSRVVVGIEDPDPRVNGQGIAALREAGIAVQSGVCADQAALLHGGHILRVRESRPFVTLKLAVTADGFIAGDARKPMAITGEVTRGHVHMLRARHDAILVGRGTVIADDPMLTCRLAGLEGCSPVRVVLDSGFETPADARLVTQEGPAVWIIGAQEHLPRAAALERAGAVVAGVESVDGRPGIAATLGLLAARGITRLMVEGGGEVADAFVAAGLVDEVVIARSPRTLGDIAPDAGPGYACNAVALLAQDPATRAYELIETVSSGDDTITILRRQGLVARLRDLSRSSAV